METACKGSVLKSITDLTTHREISFHVYASTLKKGGRGWETKEFWYLRNIINRNGLLNALYCNWHDVHCCPHAHINLFLGRSR